MSRSHKHHPCCNWYGITPSRKRDAKRESNRAVRHAPIELEIPSGKAYRRMFATDFVAFLKERHPWEVELSWFNEDPECYEHDLDGVRRMWERLYYAK